jgi:hypothetical protein
MRLHHETKRLMNGMGLSTPVQSADQVALEAGNSPNTVSFD